MEITLGKWVARPDTAATRWADENPRRWAVLTVQDRRTGTSWTYWIFSGRAYRAPAETQQE